MLRYTDFLTMAAQTTGVSLINFNRTASTMNALGLLYKMYGDHFVGAIPVALTGNSPQPAPKYPAGSPDQPEKSSGSPTYPLDMVAALSPDHRYLILSVVNATESEQNFDLSVAENASGQPINAMAAHRQYSRCGQPSQPAGADDRKRNANRRRVQVDRRRTNQYQYLSLSSHRGRVKDGRLPADDRRSTLHPTTHRCQ